jgi:copper resistance protein C
MLKRFPHVVALALAIASIGFAHAVLLEAMPAVNGSVAGPNIELHLRFNSRIDPARSRLVLVLPDRSVRALALAAQPTPATLNARVTGLSPGAYRLEWQVLATDGHITRGVVPFQVK